MSTIKSFKVLNLPRINSQDSWFIKILATTDGVQQKVHFLLYVRCR